jgi:hypothetical protein
MYPIKVSYLVQAVAQAMELEREQARAMALGWVQGLEHRLAWALARLSPGAESA